MMSGTHTISELNSPDSLVRLSTAGSVDDGKSTLIGRLLFDSKNVYQDHLEGVRGKADGNESPEGFSLALLTDGLRDEREQGITIDVAYRYFSTPKRRFILADTPGHEQYTRNMATGASTADLTILLVDARKGVIRQTKRHAFIASLLGVPRLVVAINKMDLVGYSSEVFERIREEFTTFSRQLDIREIRFIPVSALRGENIVTRSAEMPWYRGESLLEHLENVYVEGDRNMVDFRFPVQGVIRPHQDYRGYAGQIASGRIRVGDEVTVLPSGKRSRIRSIDRYHRDPAQRTLEEAAAPLSVVLTVSDEIDVARGDMIVRTLNAPPPRTSFEAMIVWLDEAPMNLTKPYLFQHTTRETKLFIDSMRYKVDVDTLHRATGSALALNEIGRISCTTTHPLFLDPYSRNRSTGNGILIDPDTLCTVGAIMVLDREPSPRVETTTNLHREEGTVSRSDRERHYGFKASTIWHTGLSGSGKSTIAARLEQKLFGEGRPVYRLDGDNLRLGINRDLSFSVEGRRENIRRVAEIAKLFNDAGITVICSLISPFESERTRAREIIGPDSFIEVYLSTPLSVCEARDPHGLYSKARRGELSGFTGVDAPYEAPRAPELSIDTSVISVEDAVRMIHEHLLR
jgi:bifunctional enzyme CysN/CysC